MKIIIDATTTQDQFASRGIGVSTREIVSHLIGTIKEKGKGDKVYLLLFDAPSSLDPEIKKESDIVEMVNIGPCRVSGKFNVLWWRAQYLPVVRRLIDEEAPDLYFSPYFFRGLPSENIPVAAMVYDFAFPYMGRYSSAPWYLDWIRKLQYDASLRQLRNVQAVIPISERTRKDLPKYLPGLEEDRLHTVHLGVREDLKQKSPSKKVLKRYLPGSVIDQGYILYYGGIEVNKNVLGIIRSYREFLDLWKVIAPRERVSRSPYLVLAGGDFTRLDLKNRSLWEIREEINKLDLQEHVEFTGYYEDEHLVDLLNGASVFVHLSYYEGFGFSPLEAMKCGIPVVASDRSCYPEVLGEGAILVDPDAYEDVGRAIANLVLNKEESTKQGREGLEWSKQYTWEETARRMYDVFEEMV